MYIGWIDSNSSDSNITSQNIVKPILDLETKNLFFVMASNYSVVYRTYPGKQTYSYMASKTVDNCSICFDTL
jgi:hypothetical protein